MDELLPKEAVVPIFHAPTSFHRPAPTLVTLSRATRPEPLLRPQGGGTPHAQPPLAHRGDISAALQLWPL